MSKQTITIVSNATTSKLLTDDRDVKIHLTKLLSYFVEGYDKTTSYKMGRWDGKSCMFDWKTYSFPTGFMESVKLTLIEEGYTVTHIKKELPEPRGKRLTKFGGFNFTGKYDYHMNNLLELEKRGQMISFIATGGGKTGCAALAIKRIARPTLILTKRQPLMYQFHKRLSKLTLKAGMIGDNRSTLNADLTVAMVQTLNRRIKEGDAEILDYLKTIEFIIGEEAHEISDEAYWNVMNHCPNAYYKMALTATPFMRNKSEANMKLLGAFGPLGYAVDEKTLIDRGILAKPVIKFATYAKPDKIKYTSNYQKAVFEGITHCVERNEVIVEESLKAAKHKLPVLILVQRKEHGKVLIANLKLAGLRADYIFGDTDSETREKAPERLSKGHIDVLIGSTILDVGIDVPSIGLVILAGGGKAEVALRQRIGRGLRAKETGPNIVFVLDFLDSHHINLYEHSKERLHVIKATSGFKDSLIDATEEFPYHLF